ncbi:MAG TPA: cupredoxin domain-containing protein [Acidimicrobiia bacterium]
MRKPLAATALIAVVALGLSACGSSSSTSSGSSKSTSTTRAAATTPVTLSGKVTNKGTKDVSTKSSPADVDMDLYSFYFEPTFVKAAPGQQLTISLHNEGSVPHTFTVPSLNIDKELQPEQKMTVTVTVPMAGSVPFYCRFHKDNGMQGAIFMTS